MQVQPIKTRIFREKENLADFIVAHVPRLPEDSVLVVTSKIVALAEGRTVADVRQREHVIEKESEFVLRTKYTWLTLKDGMVIASAGVDESNADGKLILLPKDSYKAAATLRTELMKRYRVKRLGILITDSRLLPLRAGAAGITLGYAGFKGLRDYRGLPDIFGRPLKLSQTNVADSLASAAVLVMGEGAERIPIAVVTKAPVEFVDRVSRKELPIKLENDIYLPFFGKLPASLRKRLGK